MSLFDVLGILLAIYVCYAGLTGRVLAKAGPGAQSIARTDRPVYFWTVMVIYLGLAVALILLF